MLLKNTGVLPLSKQVKKIAVIGPHANWANYYFGGYTRLSGLESAAAAANSQAGFDENAAENAKNIIMIPGTEIQFCETEVFKEILEQCHPGCQSIVERLREDLPDADIRYAHGYHVSGEDEGEYEEALKICEDADVILLTLGGKFASGSIATSGEGVDSADINLPSCQDKFICRCSELGIPMVGIHFDGRPISSDAADNCLSAILEAWNPGPCGAQAVCDVLLGNYNPSGKMPVTTARTAGQIPIYYNHPHGSAWHTGESVGFDHYVGMSHEPRYHFGYGLSYTTFAYSDLRINGKEPDGEGASEESKVSGELKVSKESKVPRESKASEEPQVSKVSGELKVSKGSVGYSDDSVTITCNITNTGSRKGTEVVQLYYSDVYASMVRPVQELAGFVRVELEPSETRTVSFVLNLSQLAFLTEDTRWKIEHGLIEVRIGGSSANQPLKGSFYVNGDRIIEGRNRELTIKRDLPTKKYAKKWQFCVGSCHASTLLRADALKILKRVHHELGIQRVCFHGTFNDDMGTLCNFPVVFGLPVGEQIVETNFYKIGVVYDNILALGMKPFVEISFMPELLAADPTRSFVYGSIHSLPKDMDKWCAYIKEYLAYLFHRYGEEEVATWYFEVWNEPDLAQTFFKGSKGSYLEFYAATARAIKEFCPKLQVGGPASSASRWVDEFVNYCEENDVPVDFISTHQYLGEPFLGVSEEEAQKSYEELEAEAAAAAEAEEKRIAYLKSALRKMPEDISLLGALHTVFGGGDGTEQDYDVNLLPNNARVVKEQAKGRPVFYTEWNLSASFGARGQDMRKVAAYDVKTSLAIEDIVDEDSIWCYSDIFEELHQFKEPFHGGYGMVTYTGIPKPVFYGMRMLAQAEENRILLDESQFTEVEAAAFEGEKEKQVILFRQNTRQIESAPEKVKLRIELSAKPKRVYLQRIDENHCNPRKVWEEMGSPNDLNKGEVEQILKASEMQDEEIACHYENGVLETEAALGVNDIYFIRIVK